MDYGCLAVVPTVTTAKTVKVVAAAVVVEETPIFIVNPLVEQAAAVVVEAALVLVAKVALVVVAHLEFS